MHNLSLTLNLAEYTIKDPIMNIVTDLIRRKPNVIGFSCYIWNIEETIKVIQMIKKIDPTIVIVVGGPEVSYDVQDWMKKVNEFDFIIIGEGEESFKRLLRELNSDDKHFDQVPGISYRHEGTILINPQLHKLDLHDLPSPYRFEEDIPQLGKRVTLY